MRKLILSLILSGVIWVTGFAQSLNNVEQSVRYRVNQHAVTLNQPVSFTANENLAVLDKRSNSQLEGLGSSYGWLRSNSQLEGLGSSYGWLRSNSQLEGLGSSYGWLRSNSQLEGLGSSYGWLR